MKRPALIFDLGGVLIRIEYRQFLEKLGINHSIDEAELLHILTPDVQLYESGNIPTEDFFHRLSHHVHTQYDNSVLHQAWYAILAGEIDGMRNIVEQLSQQTQLFLLSNTNELHFEYARKTFPVLNSFTDYFVSYRIGAMKPSRQIYDHVIRTIGAKPSDMVFIDDTESNIDGARQAGLQGILFQGRELLVEQLRNFGFTLAGV